MKLHTQGDANADSRECNYTLKGMQLQTQRLKEWDRAEIMLLGTIRIVAITSVS